MRISQRTIRRLLWLLEVVFLAAAGSGPSAAEELPPFRVGERLTYEVRLLGARAGQMTSVVQEKVSLGEIEAYHIVVNIRTTEAFSEIYRVNDEIHLYLNVRTLEPIRTDRFLEEGWWSGRIRVDFDQEGRKAYYASWDKEGKFIGGKTLSLPAPTLDVASVAYFVRGKDLAGLGSFKLNILYETDPRTVEVGVTPDQNVSLEGLGAFKTYMLRSLSYGNIALWISNDERRLPVMMITDGIRVSQDRFLPLEASLVKVESP